MSSTITIGGVEIRPTPLISVSQEPEYYDNGKIKKTVLVIEIKGKILSQDVGEQPPEDEDRFGIIQNKWNAIQAGAQQAIGEIFLDSAPSAPILQTPCKLRSKSFDISAGNIFADYTLTFEKTIIQNNYIDDKWSLDPADEYNRFVKVTRTRSIQYQDTESEDGYQKAIGKIAPTASIAEATSYLPNIVVSISDSNAYNKTVSYSVSKVRGSVDCTESWTICKDPYLVEETYSFRESVDSINPSISYQGSITGFKSESASKYQNAQIGADKIIKWNMQNGFTITGFEQYGSKIVSMSRGDNQAAGTINFSVEVVKGIEKPNERYRSVNITNNLPTPVYANIQAVGKEEGPILQNIGTYKAGNKSVTIEIVNQDGGTTLPDTSEYVPIGAKEFFVDKDESSIDIKTGKISRTTSWIYST